ncbi:toluene monooxygenase system ferredoxin subunit [Methylophilaceae bacterium]|nr:toluene monooxygenase system ferredoxin subunit [Methylophilaceae bacterium]
MPDRMRVICRSEDLQERGPGVRFDLPELGERVTGFAVRYNGLPRAYVNRCAHVPVELDWNEGDFFNVARDYLICATHGAHYQPETGYCVMGPCKGKGLVKIAVFECDNEIMIQLDSIS